MGYQINQWLINKTRVKTKLRFHSLWLNHCLFTISQLKRQYRVCPPLFLITSWSRERIEWHSVLYTRRGMCTHSWISAFINSWTLVGGLGRWRIRRPNSSQICSIGLQSGDIAGQGSKRMLLMFSKAMIALALWDGALSCMNVSPLRCWNIGREPRAW